MLKKLSLLKLCINLYINASIEYRKSSYFF